MKVDFKCIDCKDYYDCRRQGSEPMDRICADFIIRDEGLQDRLSNKNEKVFVYNVPPMNTSNLPIPIEYHAEGIYKKNGINAIITSYIYKKQLVKDKVALYSAQKREKYVERMSDQKEYLGIIDTIHKEFLIEHMAKLETDIGELIIKEMSVKKGNETITDSLDPSEIKEAEELLRSENLLETILDVIQNNIVGEDVNILAVLTICQSAKSFDPQNLDLTGDSGVGKSKDVVEVSELFKDNRILLGSASKKSIVHEPCTEITEDGAIVVDLNEKILILLEEKESKEFVNFIKPILSHDAYEITYKITQGKGSGKGHETKTVKVRGWPSYIGISTETIRDEEKSTRMWTLTPETGEKKYGAVNLDSAKRSSCPWEYKEKHSDFDIVVCGLKLLEKIKVINPFAELLNESFPHKSPRSMRDFKRLLNVIEVITLIHQKQRLKLQIYSEMYVVSSRCDLQVGLLIANKLLSATFSGIPNHVRKFYNEVVIPLNDQGEEMTYGTLKHKFQKVYGYNMPRTTLKEKYTDVLVEQGWLEKNEKQKPHIFSISDDIDGLTKIDEIVPSKFDDSQNIPCQYQEFIDKISNIDGLTPKMYINDNEVEFSFDKINEYILSPSIRQSLKNRLSSTFKKIDGELPLNSVNPSNLSQKEQHNYMYGLIKRHDKGEGASEEVVIELSEGRINYPETMIQHLKEQKIIYENKQGRLKLA